MPACQISFSAFAVAAQQAAISCTPPVLESATAVVTHPLAVDGGECIPLTYTAYLVTVRFKDGSCYRYRHRTMARARACARDFPTASVRIRPARGYMSFSGWVEV